MITTVTTTLGADIADGFVTTITVASTTGITASTHLAQRYIFVDLELMEVKTVVNSTTLVVVRGIFATGHVSGSKVIYGPGGTFDANTGNTSGVFIPRDPVGLTTAAGQEYSIVVNYNTGTEWSVVNATWTAVGGFATGLVAVSFHAQAATAMVDQTFFVADRAYQVVGGNELHAVAETTAATLRAQVTKDTGTDAPGAGTDLLTNTSNAGFDMKATANTLQVAALITTVASLTLAAGNRLSVDFSASATELVGVTITMLLKPLP